MIWFWLSQFVRIIFFKRNHFCVCCEGSIPNEMKEKGIQKKGMNKTYEFEIFVKMACGRSLFVSTTSKYLEIHFYVCVQKKFFFYFAQTTKHDGLIKLKLNFYILAPQTTKGNIQYYSFAYWGSQPASQTGRQAGNESVVPFNFPHSNIFFRLCFCLVTLEKKRRPEFLTQILRIQYKDICSIQLKLVECIIIGSHLSTLYMSVVNGRREHIWMQSNDDSESSLF